MELDIKIRILKYHNKEDNKKRLVVSHTANVQTYPLDIPDYQTRLSIFEEIYSAIVEKIDEINKRQSERSDSERYPDLESNL